MEGSIIWKSGEAPSQLPSWQDACSYATEILQVAHYMYTFHSVVWWKPIGNGFCMWSSWSRTQKHPIFSCHALVTSVPSCSSRWHQSGPEEPFWDYYQYRSSGSVRMVKYINNILFISFLLAGMQWDGDSKGPTERVRWCQNEYEICKICWLFSLTNSFCSPT